MSSLLSHLPQGRLLPEEVWARRHRLVTRVAVAQGLVLAVATALHHRSSSWSATEVSSPGSHAAHGLGAGAVYGALVLAVVVCPLALSGHRFGRHVRAVATTTSLLAASAVLVHLTSGLTEAHFHFFVMVGLAALYQDWAPFGASLAIVAVHHAAMGLLAPGAVFTAELGLQHPVAWAGVHAAAVLALSSTYLASWRLNEQQGLHDALTGLGNRTYLSELLARRLTRRAATSVLYLDLDDFKVVNDSHGHATGDELLRAVAARLRGAVRDGDEVVRLGGDEFAVVVDGDAAAAAAVAARALDTLRAPVRVGGRSLVVHTSIGSATTDPAGARGDGACAGSVETLLQQADMAMYVAKRSGTDQVVSFTGDLAERARSSAELTTDLAAATASTRAVNEHFRVHYQAVVALGSGGVVGHEALLRWQHPTRGLVPPSDFIPLAEDSGAIVPLGEWVLVQATAHAADLVRRGGRPLRMSVNVSVRQLAVPTLVQTVADALRASGLPADHLVLEITETELVRDVATTVRQLHRLRALGVRIAIDDFGTGYSSLAYLRTLPADVVKIDRSFVADLHGSDRGTATALVASIVELARSLHLDVVAEGVEHPDQDATLTGLGCAYAQGFLYARPAPAVALPTTGATAGPVASDASDAEVTGPGGAPVVPQQGSRSATSAAPPALHRE